MCMKWFLRFIDFFIPYFFQLQFSIESSSPNPYRSINGCGGRLYLSARHLERLIEYRDKLLFHRGKRKEGPTYRTCSGCLSPLGAYSAPRC